MPKPSEQPAGTSTPTHIAIIMDGNGRWAKQRHLPRIEGHRQGAEAVRRAIMAANKFNIRYLTLYAFSTENWNRPQDEVSSLMDMLEHFLSRETKTLLKHKVRLLTIGDTTALPEKTKNALNKTLADTAHFTDHNLVLALNYSSRAELLTALQKYAADIKAGTSTATPDWQTLNRYLYTADIPDPDLIIRTSGENRLSNFLLLQAAYAELYFTPVLWPDFDEKHLAEAIADYSRRERRYGLTSEQLTSP